MNEREIFVKVLSHSDPAQRLATLEEACRGDPPLKQRVEVLLKAHDRAGRFLESPAAGAEETSFLQPLSERPGTVIVGRYKLLEEIGEGGMGIVWVAEQLAPVRRRVALKLIKAGLDTRQVLSRFEAERQALALMDHPNIAKVFDGGMTDEGRSFFAMEYVKGLPITRYCDEARLTVAQRLALFTQVCQAVQHAHQKGIIHRDLKPSNILVCLYDGQPVPKVIDFGLAKAMNQSLTDHTLYTAHGLMVGTPLYMSPEQAEFNNLDIDTRSDIYSLGVILYELLTGTTPLERRQFKHAASQEMLRLIKECEPPKPSARLSTSDRLPTVAAQRNLEPAQLQRTIRGELDWIVMKSLEKERSRRYETASGLARDIERYLADEPVVAGPPSTVYKFRKFVHRHALAVWTTTALALVVAGFSLFSGLMWWQSHRSALALEKANRDLTKANTDLTASGQQVSQANAQNARLAASAQRQVRATSALYYATRSQLIREISPVQSLLLGVEAVESTRSHGEGVLPAARQSLHDALRSVGGIPLTWDGGRQPSWTDLAAAVGRGELPAGFWPVAVSPDGHWLAAPNPQGSMQLWDLTARAPWSSPILLGSQQGSIRNAVFSRNSRWLLTAGTDHSIRRWDLEAPEIGSSSVLLGKERKPTAALLPGPGDRWLASMDVEWNVGRPEFDVYLWDMKQRNQDPILMPRAGSAFRSPLDLICLPEGPWLLPTRGSPQDALRVWNLEDNGKLSRLSQYDHALGMGARFSSATISTSGHWFVAAAESPAGPGSKTAVYVLKVAADGLQDPPVILHIDGGYPTLHVSPDDRHLVATFVRQGGFHHWDLAADDISASLQVVPGSAASNLARSTISPDSRWLLVGGGDGAVRMWDLKANPLAKSERTLRGHQSEIRALTVSADSRWLTSESKEAGMRVWDLTAGDPEATVRELRGHDGGVGYLAYGAKSRWLVSAGVFDRVVRLWDLEKANLGENEPILRTTGIEYTFGRTLISQNGHWLAVPGTPPRLWDLSLRSPPDTLQELRGHKGQAYPVALSNNFLVTTAQGESPILWDLSDPSGIQMHALAGNLYFRFPAAISPDERWLVTGSGDGEARLWPLTARAANLTATLLPNPLAAPRRPGTIRGITISRDSRWLCIGHDNANECPAVVFDLTAREPAATATILHGHKGGVTSQAISADGRWLATGGRDRTVRLWDLQAGEAKVDSHLLSLQAVKYQGGSNWVPHVEVAFSPSGNWLTTRILGADRSELWNLKTGAPPTNSIVLHDVPAGSEMNTFVSPDDRWLVITGPKARLLDLRSENPLATARDFGFVMSAAFSPKSDWLLVADFMKTMLLDMTAADPLTTGIALDLGMARNVSISPDSRWMVASSDHGETRLWHLNIEQLITEARRRAGRPLLPRDLETMSPIVNFEVPGSR